MLLLLPIIPSQKTTTENGGGRSYLGFGFSTVVRSFVLSITGRRRWGVNLRILPLSLSPSFLPSLEES